MTDFMYRRYSAFQRKSQEMSVLVDRLVHTLVYEFAIPHVGLVIVDPEWAKTHIRMGFLASCSP